MLGVVVIFAAIPLSVVEAVLVVYNFFMALETVGKIAGRVIVGAPVSGTAK